MEPLLEAIDEVVESLSLTNSMTYDHIESKILFTLTETLEELRDAIAKRIGSPASDTDPT